MVHHKILDHKKTVLELDKELADRYAFILAEMATFKQSQATMVADVAEIKNDVKEIKTVLWIKRNGKDSICNEIDAHSKRILELEAVHASHTSKGWEIAQSLASSIIGAIITLIFFFLFYKP